jgi:hypothetical protein
MRRIALVAVLIVVAPIAAMIGRFSIDRAARAEFARLAPPGLHSANVTADPWRHSASVEGLALRRAGFYLHIGRLTVPFVAPSLFGSSAYAQAAQPGTISAENIAVDVGPMHYAIKNITLTGTSLSNADLVSLLDPKSTVSVADRLEKFSAGHVAIPEITMQGTFGGRTESDSYSDVSFENVINGRAAQATIGILASKIVAPESGAIQATYGPITANNLDLALAARIISEPRKSDGQPQKTLYDRLRIGGGKIVFEKAQLEIDVGNLSAKDVKARQLRLPPAATPFADNLHNDAFVADVLDSFEVGTLDVDDLRIIVTDKDAAGTGAIDNIHLSQMADAKIADAEFARLAVTAGGSSVKIGGVSMHDVDLVALRDWAASDSGHGISSASVAGEIRLTGLNVDTGESKSPTRFQIGNLGLVSADPIDGIPTRFSTSIDHFTFDPKDAGDELAGVAALGYDKIDLSSRFEAHFDAAKRELGVEDLSLSGADMGAVKIACDFGNASKDLFSADPAQMEAAALSLLLRRIEIRVENGGFFERIVAAAAKQSNKSPEEVRQAYVAAAAIGVPALLGNGPAAKAIGAAIAKFVATPKNLRIVAVAPQGLGAVDFVLIKDPSALMNKLSVQAAADE